MATGRDSLWRGPQGLRALLTPVCIISDATLLRHSLYSHNVTFLQLEVAAGVDDDVAEVVAFVANLVVVRVRQVEALHSRANQVGDFGPLDLVGVVVSRLVRHVDGELYTDRMQS